LLSGASQALWEPRLGVLLKRFEVTKRVFERYAEASLSCAGRSDYSNPSLYARFAELLALAYERTGSLQYLNALLKCMDTLTSLSGRLEGSDRALVAELAEKERGYAKSLAARLGVPWPEKS
jgi:methionyl-tRNA formyltransferase